MGDTRMDLDQELYRRKPSLRKMAESLGLSEQQASKLLNGDCRLHRNQIQGFLKAHKLKTCDVNTCNVPRDVLKALLLANHLLNKLNLTAMNYGIDPTEIEEVLREARRDDES